jgi:SAM-dependent methyltransferase
VLLTVDLDRLGVGAGDRLLDVGCGEGRHCFGALERGARVVGLDLDLDSLRTGHGPLRARARERGGSGVMLRGDAFHLPFRDARFDRAICSEVMEHVHDYPAAARELARVVRPGGTVAVTVPTATSEALYLRARRRLLRVAGRPHPDLPAPRARRRAARRRPGADRRRLRPRVPHAVLGAALGGGAAPLRRQPAGAGLPDVPDQGDHLALARPLREARARLPVPQEPGALREAHRGARGAAA